MIKLEEKPKKIWEAIKAECIRDHDNYFIISKNIAEELIRLPKFKHSKEQVNVISSAMRVLGTIENIRVYYDPSMSDSDSRVIFLNSKVIELNELINKNLK